MSKQGVDALIERMYAAYVNIRRKQGFEPIEYWQFKLRFKMWEEW